MRVLHGFVLEDWREVLKNRCYEPGKEDDQESMSSLDFRRVEERVHDGKVPLDRHRHQVERRYGEHGEEKDAPPPHPAHELSQRERDVSHLDVFQVLRVIGGEI